MKAQPDIKEKINKEVFIEKKQEKYADWKISIVDKSALEKNRKMWQVFDMKSQVSADKAPGSLNSQSIYSTPTYLVEPELVSFKGVLGESDISIRAAEIPKKLKPEISKFPGSLYVQSDVIQSEDELSTLIKSKEEEENMKKTNFFINFVFSLFLGAILFANIPDMSEINTLKGIKEFLDFVVLVLTVFIMTYSIRVGIKNYENDEKNKKDENLWLDADTIGIPGEKVVNNN